MYGVVRAYTRPVLPEARQRRRAALEFWWFLARLGRCLCGHGLALRVLARRRRARELAARLQVFVTSYARYGLLFQARIGTPAAELSGEQQPQSAF